MLETGWGFSPNRAIETESLFRSSGHSASHPPPQKKKTPPPQPPHRPAPAGTWELEKIILLSYQTEQNFFQKLASWKLESKLWKFSEQYTV